MAHHGEAEATAVLTEVDRHAAMPTKLAGCSTRAPATAGRGSQRPASSCVAAAGGPRVGGAGRFRDRPQGDTGKDETGVRGGWGEETSIPCAIRGGRFQQLCG